MSLEGISYGMEIRWIDKGVNSSKIPGVLIYLRGKIKRRVTRTLLFVLLSLDPVPDAVLRSILCFVTAYHCTTWR